MNAKARHLAVGAAGEEAAVKHLKGIGWRVLERNWRPRGARHGLELDIVARSGGDLVFVEVKTRSCGRGGSAAMPVHAAFTVRKQTRLMQAARRYLAANALWACPCRFDLICVRQAPDGRMELEHHYNVIESGHIVDSGDTAWQPW